MVALTHSLLLTGLSATIVTVEVDIVRGLPGLTIIGRGNKAVQEAVQRVRSALTHADLALPPRKYTVNLAPAELPKEGTHFDVAIAVALLVAVGFLKESEVVDSLFLGELSLTGAIRPSADFSKLLTATLVDHHSVIYGPPHGALSPYLPAYTTYIPITHVKELFQHLKGIISLTPLLATSPPPAASTHPSLDTVIGQAHAKRAVTIALAGNHHLLMIGAPGVGKSLIAATTAGLLPPISKDAALEVAQLHSKAAIPPPPYRRPPYRSPHHSLSVTGLLGSHTGRPGELSLAHRGILFLDELAEFQHRTLESLRQPMEQKVVRRSIGKTVITLPADCLIIAATNPCPCGFYGSSVQQCRCLAWQRQRYQQRISGPILDRFDMCIILETEHVEIKNQTKIEQDLQHIEVLKVVEAVRSTSHNAANSSNLNNVYVLLSDEAQTLLASAAQQLALSQRGQHATVRVAHTIARLEQAHSIQPAHVAEALQYRTASWLA